MFQCIGCSKQAVEEDRDEQHRQTETATGNGGGTPATNQAVKSLTAQMKDMALKFTGAHKQPRSSGAGPSAYQRGSRPNDAEGVQYPYMGGVGSEPVGIGGDQTSRRNARVASYGGVSREEEDNDIMWIAQVEPGVHITFVPHPNGGNDLRRVRFNRDMFDRWQAQRWWGENFDRIIELYNVQRFNRQALNSPPNSEDEQIDTPPVSRQPSGHDSPVADWLNNGSTLRNDQVNHGQNMHAAGSSILGMTSSQDDHFFGNAGQGEWIEEDMPGVFLTIRLLPDGSKDLRRVRFSRQRFGEDAAKMWWEGNRERIQVQYLS